jgi:hypothetical protein
MKKNILSLAVAASAAGMTSLATAQMYINTEGTGEALVFPFYSAQNGNDTLISIANTTAQTKAVKIRIIESQESEEVLDFNLYMSPQDHFSFAITADGDGAKLRTADTSCTVPEIPETDDGAREQAFTDLLLLEEAVAATDDAAAIPAQELGDAASREQIGYIEVIEMGQLDPASIVPGDEVAGTAGRDYVTAITHVDGTPADCAAIVASWSVTDDVEGAWYEDANAEDVGVNLGDNGVGTIGFLADWAGGGLYGVATVINVAEGTAFGYDAVAIENLVDDDNALNTGSILHYAPGDTRPDFTDTAISTTATVAINGTQVTYTNPDVLLNSLSHHTVSAVMMSDSISNDYVVDPTINALTDWIVTMPTKSHYDDAILGWQAPFTWEYEGGESGTEAKYPNDCQPFSLTVYDREEGTLEPPPIPDADPSNDGPQFSPFVRPEVEEGVTPDGVDPVLCSETTVVHFGGASATNTSEADEDEAVIRTLTNVNSLLSDEDQAFTAGWAVMDLSGTALNNPIDTDRLLPGTVAGADFDQLRGLPVTGFAVVEYTNGVLGSAMANYQSAWEHKTSVVSSAD